MLIHIFSVVEFYFRCTANSSYCMARS